MALYPQQEPQPPQKKRHRGLKVTLGILGGLFALTIIGSHRFRPRSSNSTGTNASSSTNTRTSNTAAAPSASSAPSCGSQLITWRNNGGGVQITAVSKDLEAAASASSTGSLAATQGAVSQLSTDAQTALSNPSPACVPQMSTDYTTAMHDFVAAATSVSLGTVSGIQTASAQVTAGGAALVRATHNLKRFERTSQ
jgi:hypothetical protein